MSDVLQPFKGLVHRVRDAVTRHRHGDGVGLQIIRDPPDADIDIVAVHGLGEHGFKSWITRDPSSGSTKPWLEEFLSADIPNARIMTYNYVCNDVGYRYIVLNVLYGRALGLTENLVALRQQDDTNRRPLFFIAHSLGGWIVKRALILSSEALDPELRGIELSTCGVAFFGTISPGRPSSPSPLAHVIRRTSGRMDVSELHAPSMQLQASDIEWLERQMAAFKGITSNLPKLSFYETKKTNDEFVAERKHSMTSSDGTQIGLTSNHSDLIKFRGRDANYKAFITSFRDMVEQGIAGGLMEARRKIHKVAAVRHLDFGSKNYAIPYHIPEVSETLVLRPSLAEQINAVFGPPASASKTLNFRIIHLWGAEGTGKTSLAIHYAELHMHELSFVFWISAESWETAVASYIEFATTLIDWYSKKSPREEVESELGLVGIDDMAKAKSIMHLDKTRVMSVVSAVKDWLMRPGNDGWLLVMDNAPASYDVCDFVPLTLSGKVILISQEGNACKWGTKIQVGAMSEAEAVEMLNAGTELSVTQRPTELETAKAVVRRLNYRPLSIAQAASTIRSQQILLSDYHKKFGEKSQPHIFGSTIDQFPLTRTILRISAMLSSSAIPTSLFNIQSAESQVPDRFAEAISDMRALQEQGNLEDVLQHLLDMNFIQTTTPSDASTYTSSTPASSPSSKSSTSTGYFIVDNEARAQVRKSLSEGERLENAWLACQMCVGSIRQNSADSTTLREVHSFGKIMAPHAKTCYDDWAPALESIPDSSNVAWHVLGNVCMTQGAVDQAIGCFELALRQEPPMEPLDGIQTSLSLAQLLEQRGSYDESSQVLNSINIESIDKALGFQVAFAKASAVAARGELSDAEYRYETLEHEQEQALGPAHAETVGTVQMLASTLKRLGKLQDAQTLYRRVHLSYQTTFGQDHPMTLGSLDDLAHISKAIFAIDDAESLYQKSVDIKSRSLGATHPRTALALQNLASIDDLRGRYTAARAKYEKALDAMLPTLGRAHPHYTMTMKNLAHSLRCHGQVLDDEEETARADSQQRRKKGQLSRDAESSLHAQTRDAVMHDAARRRAFEDAERIYIEVIETQKAARDMYSDNDLLETASKLCEMYETSSFFAAEKEAKVSTLKKLLREGRRRGTV